jgi:NADH-quinone oxidoreductase subunit C
MDAPALIAALQNLVPGLRVESAPARDRQTTVVIEPGDVLNAMQALRDGPELRCALLAELTAVDFWPKEPRFELIYLIVSIEHRFRVRVKVRLPGTDPHVATVTPVWPGANWLEREVWDLFGIAFDDHPDPRRLLMPEDWEGFPLRKDYPVQIRMTPRTGEPLQVTQEEFRANLQRDRLSRPQS